MKNLKSNLFAGVLALGVLTFSPSSQAGLLGDLFNAIFRSTNQYGSGNGNQNNSGSGSGNGNGNSSNSNNYSGYGNTVVSGVQNPQNGNIDPGNSSQGGGVTAVSINSVPQGMRIPRCPAGIFENIKFPNYSGGSPQAMPANARSEKFDADLPSGQDDSQITLACSNSISPQAKSVDGNNYKITGDLNFTCISGSWMLTNSTCRAEILPVGVSSTAATTSSTNTLNGVTCPAGSTPTPVTAAINYGAAANNSVECRVTQSATGYGPTTVQPCNSTAVTYGGVRTGC